MINYYVLDIESTGLKVNYNEINQISIIRLSDGFQRTFNVAVEHPSRASAQVLKVQNITVADLKKGSKIKDVISDFDNFLQEDGLDSESRCIIGHNIMFDRKFLHATWEDNNKYFLADLWFCTKKFMRQYVKKMGTNKIIQAQGVDKVKYGQDLCLKGLGISPKVGAHSATIDCQNCLSLYSKLMESDLNHIRLIERIPHREKSADSNEIYFDY